MAPIPFDSVQQKDKNLFNFTFGLSRETSRWTDVKAFNFEHLSSFLSKVPAVGKKDGRCYTPALFSGHVRTLQETTQIDVAVLDSDCGHELEQIRKAVVTKGWRTIVHSTYSHLTEETVIASSAYRKWCLENPNQSIEKYLLDKKGFLPNVVKGAHIVDQSAETVGGNLTVKHAPCPKFRILLPLTKSWLASNYESQDIANAKWRERIGALAYSLGLHHDQSCSDTSRLFYFPRVRNEAAAADYVCETLGGEDCDLWSLPDAQIPSDRSSMGSLFDQYGSRPPSTGGNVVPMPSRWGSPPTEKKTFTDKLTGKIFDLTAWASRYANRFEISKALIARKPGIISPRRAGVKTHIYCVRSGDHMTGGLDGSGTYVVNASDLARAGLPSINSGFVVHCSHNGCKGVDRLDHIKEMLRQDVLSIEDLTDPQFLMQEEDIKVDISQFLNKVKENKNGESEDKEEKAEKEPKQSKSKALVLFEPVESADSTNISPALYEDLPGVLGAFHKFILATSPKPQPVLALGAALSFCATVIGQRVKLESFGVRPNIYVLAVGVSGSGKDRPMSACKQVAQAAGLFDELIGVEDVASDSGIVASVVKSPRQLMLIDEASVLLNTISDPRAGAHLKGVVGTMLKLYSSSDGKYKSKSYADSERNTSIDQPCVSFFGSCTPRGLSDALTNKDIESGLLSRMVIFDAGSTDPRITAPENIEVPDSIVEWVTAWNAVKPVPNLMHLVGGAPVISPRQVMITAEATKIAMDFEGEMHEAKGKARRSGKDALYVRAFENALKFALIRACSIWPIENAIGTGVMVDESALKVDAPIMRWAVDLSRTTVERMVMTTDDIADTAYEQQLKMLRKVIKMSAGRGMSTRDLARCPAGRMAPRALDDLLKTLSDAGDIARFPKKRGARLQEVYAYKSHWHLFSDKKQQDDDDDGDDDTSVAGEG